jgi:ankyrin repeat protein
LNAGADVNMPATICSLGVQDKVGYTVVMAGGSHNHWKTVQLLIEHGANVNAKAQWGTTALSLAAEERAHRSASLLRRAGAKEMPV